MFYKLWDCIEQIAVESRPIIDCVIVIGVNEDNRFNRFSSHPVTIYDVFGVYGRFIVIEVNLSHLLIALDTFRQWA